MTRSSRKRSIQEAHLQTSQEHEQYSSYESGQSEQLTPQRVCKTINAAKPATISAARAINHHTHEPSKSPVNLSAADLDDDKHSVDGEEHVTFGEIREPNGKNKLCIPSEAPRSSVEYIHVLSPSRTNCVEIEESPPRRVREP